MIPLFSFYLHYEGNDCTDITRAAWTLITYKTIKSAILKFSCLSGKYFMLHWKNWLHDIPCSPNIDINRHSSFLKCLVRYATVDIEWLKCFQMNAHLIKHNKEDKLHILLLTLCCMFYIHISLY